MPSLHADVAASSTPGAGRPPVLDHACATARADANRIAGARPVFQTPARVLPVAHAHPTQCAGAAARAPGTHRDHGQRTFTARPDRLLPARPRQSTCCAERGTAATC